MKLRKTFPGLSRTFHPYLKSNVIGFYLDTFFKTKIILLTSRYDRSNQIIKPSDGSICFMDGSSNHRLGQSGDGIINRTTNQEYVLPLGKYSTPFQAVCAILMRIKSLHTEQEAPLAVYSDS